MWDIQDNPNRHTSLLNKKHLHNFEFHEFQKLRSRIRKTIPQFGHTTNKSSRKLGDTEPNQNIGYTVLIELKEFLIVSYNQN